MAQDHLSAPGMLGGEVVASRSWLLPVAADEAGSSFAGPVPNLGVVSHRSMNLPLPRAVKRNSSDGATHVGPTSVLGCGRSIVLHRRARYGRLDHLIVVQLG